MPFTSEQWTRIRSRERGRRMAWADGRAHQVGYYDALLFRGQCPYPIGSPAAVDWQAGYDLARREREDRRRREDAALTEVISSMRGKVEK